MKETIPYMIYFPITWYFIDHIKLSRSPDKSFSSFTFGENNGFQNI